MTNRERLAELVSANTKLAITAVSAQFGVYMNTSHTKTKKSIVDRLLKVEVNKLLGIMEAMPKTVAHKKRVRADEEFPQHAGKKKKLNDSTIGRNLTEADVMDSTYLIPPSEDIRRQLVADFIHNTGNDSTHLEVCCICACECTGTDVKPTPASDIPNVHLLRPFEDHPAHTLTNGVLLYTDSKGNVPTGACTECLGSLTSGKVPKYSLANGLWVGEVPHALKILTLAERILISRYISAAYVVKLHPKKASGRIPRNQLSSSLIGNVSKFKLDTQGIAGLAVDGQLPFHPRVLVATILVTFVGAHNIPMRVLQPLASINRERVAAALRWLIANNPIYADIEISDKNLALLPEDGIPEEVLASVKWSDNTLVLNQERAGYVPDDADSDCEEGSTEHSMSEGESDEEDPMGLEDATSLAAVFPILAHGVIDVEGNNIPRSELLAHAFQNMTSAGKPPIPVDQNQRFNVRHGDFVNEYSRKDEAGKLTIGPPGNPNHLLGCYPHLFPYGKGSYETDRKVNVSYEAHAKWSLQYADRRFRKDLDFVFQVFGVLQKRKICTSAAMRMSCSDYQKHKEAINRLTTKDFEVAAEQEMKKQQYSNPAMRALVSHLSAVRAGVMGMDQNRASVRAQVWSLITMYNPPTLWITINPSDVNNPIAQIFAGEQIDLDKFDQLAGPDATARSIMIAKDPYAAAKFFHFIVRAILHSLMGIEVQNGRITRKPGIYGVVKAYVGMVESQGRGMLHLHMLVFLDGAPPPSVMAQCLRGDQFCERVAGFISVNLRADVGMGVEEMRSLKATPAVGYNRPLDPWLTTYAQDVKSQEKHLARSLQLHECSIGRCLQNKNGRRFCKNRAPWKTSAEDWINEKGEWGMKRLNPYLNGFNPTILETIFCNNDVKLITNGAETQDSVWYFSAYQTKKKKKSNNTSAIVAKRFAFHNIQEKANKEDKDIHKRLITRCATALNREQEFSASEVVSYLMGWGDRYISHQFIPIYLDGIGAALRKTYPDLLHKRWKRSVGDNGNIALVEMRQDNEAEGETVQLRIEKGQVTVGDQLRDYVHRPVTMESYNVLTYFRDTYDEYCTSSNTDRIQGEQGKSNAGHPRSARHMYNGGYKPKHMRIERQAGFEMVPQFVGKWFPRNDEPNCMLQYQLTMLAILKPWRKLEDLVRTHTSAASAWSSFIHDSCGKYESFLENIQYFYRSSDQSVKKRAEEYTTYNFNTDSECTAHTEGSDVGQRNPEYGTTSDGTAEWTTEDIIRAQDAIPGREQAYATSAMECAYEAGIFTRDTVLHSEAEFAERCSPVDKLEFDEWGDYLRKYVAEGGRIVNDNSVGGVLASSIVHGNSNPGIEIHSNNEDQQQSNRWREMLNEDQALVHDIVMDHLNATISGKAPQQLLMIIRGPGGTGKTVAVNTIMESFKSLGMESALAKTATSGVAATLINGRTVHSWAGLPIRKQAGDNWVVGSPPIAKKRMRNMQDVQYLIIDEKSMATKDMIAQLSTIIDQVRSSLELPGAGNYFSGMNVILCGDFHQFPPVGSISSSLFHPSTGGPLSILGKEIYHTFDKVVTLRQQMRVQDERWKSLLDRLHHGDCSEDDMKEVDKLRLDIGKNPTTDFDSDGWREAVLITPWNSARKLWNATAIRKHRTRHGQRLYSCPAEDTFSDIPLTNNEQMCVASMKNKDTGNLNHRIELAVGMKAMVVLNIATEADLANGTRGTVTGLVLDDCEPAVLPVREGICMLQYPPAVVFFRPDGGTVIHLKGVEAGLLPIVPSKMKFTITIDDGKRKQVTRRQLALTAGYAFTDYKGQGQTIKFLVVDLEPPSTGPKMSGFSVYVALSRSRGRSNIRILRGYDLQLFVHHPSEDLKVDESRLDVIERDTQWAWSSGKRYT